MIQIILAQIGVCERPAENLYQLQHFMIGNMSEPAESSEVFLWLLLSCSGLSEKWQLAEKALTCK